MVLDNGIVGGGWPIDKNEGGVKDELVPAVFLAPFFSPEKVEDQDSGNLTLNHSAGAIFPPEDRSTTHRFGLNLDHDSSMRTSRLLRMRRGYDRAWPTFRDFSEAWNSQPID